MKGRQILIEPLPGGGDAAALLVDGRLHDLLLDPGPEDQAPRPEAIYRAIAGRPMKGMGGAIVDLGNGATGFLRSPKLPAPGRPVLVQVSGWAEPGKAPPVGTRLRLKGRYAILTPGAPGHNISRNLRESARREELAALAAAALGSDPELGLVLRTAAGDADDDAIRAELAELLAAWERIAGPAAGPAGLAHPGPGAADEARRDWHLPGDHIRAAPTALADAGIWEDAAELAGPLVRLGQGSMAVEPTRALVAVDVNTGGDTSPAAALKVNLAAAAELPRQLRLRGLGGQITIDFAPLTRQERGRIEAALTTGLRADDIETTLAGWSPLGHLELQRKRARRPLDPRRLPV